MEAIILAGGLGTRLSSRLPDLPKSMAPVAGRPFLEFLLDTLISAGCGRVILSVGHLRHVILSAFQKSYRGVPLDYVIEETPLGTGGAIQMALRQAREPAVLVLNGDTYLDADFAAMHALHLSAGRPMTMAVAQVKDVARYGGVVIESGHVMGFIEKGRQGPGWINAGTYVLSQNFPWPEGLPSRFSFETDVLTPFLERLRPTAFLCDGFFLDIGIPEDLDRAQVELANQNRMFRR
jgi:D-glycero-alpha-D-manno-heptose 1-phosphate guanylyltransferase